VRAHGFDHRVRIGPAASEQARHEPFRARSDERSIDQDVELAGRTDLELGVDSGL
jgi:hypothetical protein